MMRYPLALDEHEDTFARLGDDLTEDEMRARFAEIDRLAVLAKWTPEPATIRGEYPWQTFLGIVGLVVMVLGIAAVLFGVAHGAEDQRRPKASPKTPDISCDGSPDECSVMWSGGNLRSYTAWADPWCWASKDDREGWPARKLSEDSFVCLMSDKPRSE